MQNRQEVEDDWRKRLESARLRLACVRQHVKYIQRVVRDIPSPDGKLAYRQALQAENEALAEYRRILQVFTDLVVEGRMPDERAG